MDQAGQLRERAKELRQRKEAEIATRPHGGGPRVIAIASGKGGVGKTNVTANLAVALAKRGLAVLVLDADLGLANIDIVLGLSPKYTIEHLLSGERTLKEVLITGPRGVKVLPASSGMEQLTTLTEDERMKLLAEFEAYDEPIDVLLIDTSAGIGQNVMYFAAAAQQTLVVTTAEPTAITDAYALMKVLSTQYGENRFLLLPNNVPHEKVAKKIYQDLSGVAAKFLNISIDLVGFIPTDTHVSRSVRTRQPVIEAFPDSIASAAFDLLAERIMASKPLPGVKGNIQFLWRRLLGRD